MSRHYHCVGLYCTKKKKKMKKKMKEKENKNVKWPRFICTKIMRNLPQGIKIVWMNLSFIKTIFTEIETTFFIAGQSVMCYLGK